MNNEQVQFLTSFGFVFPSTNVTAVTRNGAGRFVVNSFEGGSRWQVFFKPTKGAGRHWRGGWHMVASVIPQLLKKEAA
jgi:hypothetical protein